MRVESLADIDREEVRRHGLYRFVERAWSQVCPDPFVGNWHQALICQQLERIASGEIDRLVINQPPQTGKSYICSTLFPAWLWIDEPATPYIGASYKERLARRDALRHRNLVNSPWWQERWPGCDVPTQSTRSAMDFKNRAGGRRISTSTGTSPVGEHGNFLFDDLLKPIDAFGRRALARTEIDSSLEWLRSTMSPRLVAGGWKVNVMQRLHPDDPAAEMLRTEDGVVHLRLPMRAEAPGSCPITTPHECIEDPRDEGDLLWAARYDEREVDRMERACQPRAWAAQYQQRPSPPGGSVFKTEWLAHRWRRLPAAAYTERARWAMYWDFAGKLRTKDTGAFVAGVVGCKVDGKIYVVDLVRGRWGLVDSCKAVVDLVNRWPRALHRLFEHAALAADVKEQVGLPGIQLEAPVGSKEDRAESTTAVFAAGDVLFPAHDAQVNDFPDYDPSWVVPCLGELAAFPWGAFKDQVDALVHLVRHLTGRESADYDRFQKGLAELIGGLR